MNIASLYENLEYGEDRPAVKVMIDNTHIKEVRIVFRKGQEMREHKTKFPIVVEIVDGIISFGVNGERYELEKGKLIALEGHIAHDLIAVKDSVVRLSLNKSDDVSRVEKVISA